MGCKHDEAADAVCCCFSHITTRIAADALTHGRNTIAKDIKHEVAAGRCTCETGNPSGRCCLGRGEVTAVA